MSASEKPTWLLNPPDPGFTHFHVQVGENATLTPELKNMLDELSRALIKQELVRQEATDPCVKLWCGGGTVCYGECTPYHHPCYNCNICNPQVSAR